MTRFLSFAFFVSCVVCLVVGALFFETGRVKLNPQGWVLHRSLGTRDLDPFQNFRHSVFPRSASSADIGLQLTLDKDRSGRRITGRCTYRLVLEDSALLFWSLTTSRVAQAETSSLFQSAFLTRARAIRDQTGRVNILIGRNPSPLNWLYVPTSGSYRLIFHLYAVDEPTFERLVRQNPHLIGSLERGACS